MEVDAGKCSTCGFLGVREGAADSGFVAGPLSEVTVDRRSKGAVTALARGSSFVPAFPVCAIGVIRIDAEIRTQVSNDVAYEGAAAKILSIQRHCEKWYPYSSGMTPGEHLEEKRMIDFAKRQEAFLNGLLAQNQTFLDRLERDRRNWEDQQQKESAKRDASRRRFDIFLVVIGLLIALGSWLAPRM